jgi:hypothetical protein
MSVDITSPVTEINHIDDYNDDIFVKQTNKTLRKIYNCNHTADPVMYINRNVDGTFIPTTDADASLKLRDVCLYNGATTYGSRWSSGFYGKSISLRNHGLFKTIFDELDKYCISKKIATNFYLGSNIIQYVLPVTGYIDSADLYQEDIYKPNECPKKQNAKQNAKKQQQQPRRRRKIRSWKYYETQKMIDEKSRYILVNGNMYSVDNVYKRSGTTFVPVVIHKPSNESIFDEHQQTVRSRRSVGIAITVSFIKDTNLTGFVLEPEPMKFDYVYEDAVDHRSRSGNRGFIKCLTNDPGFITKFELFYRSTMTGGQWVKYNIFDGNVNNYTPIKIVFDEEIVAKEIRIVPISYVNSFEKVNVTPFTTILPDEKTDKDDTVTYYIETSHNPDSTYICKPDCFLGRGYKERTRTKGHKKIKTREFREMCDF